MKKNRLGGNQTGTRKTFVLGLALERDMDVAIKVRTDTQQMVKYSVRAAVTAARSSRDTFLDRVRTSCSAVPGSRSVLGALSGSSGMSLVNIIHHVVSGIKKSARKRGNWRSSSDDQLHSCAGRRAEA